MGGGGTQYRCVVKPLTLWAPVAPSLLGTSRSQSRIWLRITNRGARKLAYLPTGSFPSWWRPTYLRSISSPAFPACPDKNRGRSQIFPVHCSQSSEWSVERMQQGVGGLRNSPHLWGSTWQSCISGQKQENQTMCVFYIQTLILMNYHACFSVLAIWKLRTNV